LFSFDLIIKNGTIVTPRTLSKADIGIKKGVITSLSTNLDSNNAEKIIDAKGKLVLPGLIDAHTHLREPGTEHRETFETGTKAAAAGGLTTVFEMPIAKPPVSTEESFKYRHRIVDEKAVIDFGLYGGAGKDNIDHIESMWKAGAIGFKTFMINPPPNREEEYWGLYVTDNSQLFSVFREIAKTGLVSAVHAEDSSLVGMLIDELKSADRKDPKAHLESRPNFVEELAVYAVAALGNIAGVDVHVSHLSTKEGLKIIKEAKRLGQSITTETCPHYLLLSEEDMNTLGPLAKINPPLRSKTDVENLWYGLRDGSIDVLASDHAPYAPHEKLEGYEDIWKSQSGAPQLETTLPLMLTKINEGYIDIQRLVEVMSENPAKIFGVYPKKGSIHVGSDADFTIVDMKKEATIDPSEMYSKARDLTPYNGWKVKGVPVKTIVRGVVVMDEGEIIGELGFGKIVTPISKLAS
jgi:allantoinase